MLPRLLLIVVWLSWCFPLAPAAHGQQPIEVTLFEGGEGVEFYLRAAQEYAKLKPGTNVNVDGDPNIADKLRMRVLEGRVPEVTNANLDFWSLIAHDRIQPLDAWLDGPSWNGKTTWRESFLPGSLDGYTYHGKTYGVPLVYVVWSVYYDKALFRRHGWKAPATWPEFLDLCRKMLEAGVAPVAFQGRYPFYAKALVQHTYYQSAGRDAYDAQQRLEKQSYDNEAMVESLSILETMSRAFFMKGFLGMSHTEAQLEFFQGRAAMLFCGSWVYSEMRDNIAPGFELGAFPLPLPVSPFADPGAGFATSGYWFVFKNSRDPSTGVDFLRYLTSTEVAGAFAEERGITVAVAGANARLHPKMADVAAQIASVARTYGVTPGVQIPGMDQVWNDTLAMLLAGRVSAREAAAQMERGASTTRTAYEHPNHLEVRHGGKTALLLLFLVSGLLAAMWRKVPRSTPAGATRLKREAIIFLVPSLVIFTLFFMLPSALALLASATRWDGLGRPEWVGTLNFQRLLLESDAFWSAFSNNLFLMVVIPSLVLPISLALANALHHGVWGSRVFRIAFFFPNLLGVAGILLWQLLYNPQGGPINAALAKLGLAQFDGFAWLSPEHLYTALIPMGVWGACGFNMVLFLAAMQSVPEDLYEAAALYGASAVQKFRYITLPMIWETVVAATLFMLIGGMKAFEAIWLLTNGSPTSDTHVVGTLMVRSMFVEQKIGQAAAIACLLFATVLVGSLSARQVLGESDA